MTSRLRIVLVLSVGLMVMAGGVTFVLLTDTHGRVCTLKLPTPSAVDVIVREREAGSLLRGRACLGSRCRPLRRQRGRVPVVWGVGFPIPRRPGTRPLVVVLERAGQPAEVLSRRVRLERREENGPGCGTEWQGLVRYAEGTLVQVPYSDRPRYLRG